MKQVYLSPHLDDAVLSCGGAIHRRAAAGETVLVLTIFSGEARSDRGLSPFALYQHAQWGHLPRPMAQRRAEDLAALLRLRAEAQHLGYLDAVYRADAAGRWLYTDLETLMGQVHPADPLLQDGVSGLANLLNGLMPRGDNTVVYAPLGVGGHVDHRIVHLAARQLLARGHRLAFYEDYPYAERDGALEAALAAAGAEGWQPEAVPLDAADLAAKVAALGYYRSQMAVLFGGAEAMPSRVWAFAASRSPGVGLAERIWWPTAASSR